MKLDLRRLVLDANIMTSALLGKSFPLLLSLTEQGIDLMTPLHQIAETREHVLREAKDADWTRAQMQRLLTIVQPLSPALYARHEALARARLHARGQPDWPLIAAAIAVDADVWSHDKDLFGTGAPVWCTRILRSIELAAQ